MQKLHFISSILNIYLKFLEFKNDQNILKDNINFFNENITY